MSDKHKELQYLERKVASLEVHDNRVRACKQITQASIDHPHSVRVGVLERGDVAQFNKFHTAVILDDQALGELRTLLLQLERREQVRFEQRLVT